MEEDDAPPESAIVGLCSDCAHAKKLKTKIDATIYLCGRAAADSRFPKFPRLPIMACAGYEKSR
jgi:hypothetical protein